jgi:hypothetical protein
MPLALKSATGSLTASIFENAEAGIRKQMFFAIAIPVTLPFQGKPVATELQLDFIRLATETFADMEDKTFWFPVNPAPGYIDGSLSLGNADNPVDCTRIAFGSAAKGLIPVEVEYTIDFTAAGPAELGVVEGILKTHLAFDGKSLGPIMAEGALLG